MKISNMNQLNDFIGAINKCSGEVWLESPEGEKFDLKPRLGRYIAIGKLLSEQGEFMELFCGKADDEKNFFSYFGAHPEVCC